MGKERKQHDLRVGAVLRKHNALPYECGKRVVREAKAAINNCRVGRAAKSASPVVSTKRKEPSLGRFFRFGLQYRTKKMIKKCGQTCKKMI